MTSSSDQHPLQSPQLSASDSSLVPPKVRSPERRSPLSSIRNLPYGRANSSFSNLFASTSALPTRSVTSSNTTTPPPGLVDGSVFSPGTPKAGVRSVSPAHHTQPDEITSLILRAFVPHVSVLTSPDCEELLRHKGIHGGLLELLRPFGERIPGRVVIRDSTGASRPWDDFGVRFTGVKDGLEAPRRSGSVSGNLDPAIPAGVEYRPARLRSGGDVLQIDEVVERHLDYAEGQSDTAPTDYLNHKEHSDNESASSSLFFALYLRRMLSGLPLSPHETFSHPVATVIAISSRSASPIEELRSLYTSSNTGEHRLPQWVNNEYLRYYVLIHDEDYDDIKKSTSLFEQMKRHFGLHCHLLRLRSAQCVSSDDDSLRLPNCEWISAAEELTEIVSRENTDDDEDPSPYIFESDAAAVRSFIREMVTQSIIPGMERVSATWNDQVASRRRGISGRFMSLSKRFTPFSGRSATGPAASSSGSNYDAINGFYRPDSPEAIMRKLADYSVMLRDFKLAQNIYDILCADFKNDKAWKYYAGASEMAAITTLLTNTTITARLRVDTIDQLLENAYYSYTTRSSSPFNAQRALLLGAELLKVRSGSSLDDAARWLSRIIDDRLVGPAGHALIVERVAACFTSRRGVGSLQSGARKRKAAFWSIMAADAWLELDKPTQAKKCLGHASALYNPSTETQQNPVFDGIMGFSEWLRETIDARKPDLRGDEEASTILESTTGADTGEPEPEKVNQSSHRRSISAVGALSGLDPLGAAAMSPSGATSEKPLVAQDGFE